MSRTIRAACIQLNAGPVVTANLEAIAPRLAEASAQGAELIALPENVTLMGGDAETRKAQSFDEQSHPAILFFSAQARSLKTWILCGSIAIKRSDGKADNRSLLFDPDGSLAASYNKIHLFDANLGQGEDYHESARIAPGKHAVLARTPLGVIGMTICYDMRFAKLYRDLAKAGAEIITVPAAFTVPTGQAHWHSLLRTRAIETGCFILAPAQCGTHVGGRKTYGHSLIIDPWGVVLAEADGDLPQIIFADLNLDDVARVRQMLPSLQHDRDYALPE